MTQLHSQLNTRAKVVATLERIQQGESLASLFDPLLNQVSEKTKAFAHELLLGTLRQWWALTRIGESLIEHEVTDKGVWAALNIGLYQLLYMDTPDYAAIVKQSKQSNNWIKVTVLTYQCHTAKGAKKPCQICQKIEETTVHLIALPKQLKQDWGEYYAEFGTSASPTCAHILTRQSQIL